MHLCQMDEQNRTTSNGRMKSRGCVKIGASSFLASVRKAGCVHAHSFISLKREEGMSEPPLN